ncbi:MAG: trypsin-like serine peptidase [Pseudonocardiaceae bacterium]
MLAGIALASATAAVAAPAAAAPAPGKAPDHAVASHEAAMSKAEQRQVEDYWTPERMRSATPSDLARPGKQNPGKGHGKGGKNRTDAVQESPQPELGKVFFTLGGTDYVCSGTATTSGNADVVTTAGHCLNEGPGDYATNFAFVPAYENGNRPYGTWTAAQLFTTSQWANSGDFEYDAGFAVMNENSSGQSLTDVVGSYPIAFNAPRGLTYTSYGYPAGPPFDGESLWSCTGTATDDPNGSTTQGIPCDMTGGSSGGGWITGGELNSVNSYKYIVDPSTMYGPYFGSTIQSAYAAAAGA